MTHNVHKILRKDFRKANGGSHPHWNTLALSLNNNKFEDILGARRIPKFGNLFFGSTETRKTKPYTFYSNFFLPNPLEGYEQALEKDQLFLENRMVTSDPHEGQLPYSVVCDWGRWSPPESIFAQKWQFVVSGRKPVWGAPMPPWPKKKKKTTLLLASPKMWLKNTLQWRWSKCFILPPFFFFIYHFLRKFLFLFICHFKSLM